MVSPPAWLQRPWRRFPQDPRLLHWWVLAAGLLITLMVCAAQQRFSQEEHQRLERVLADDISAALSSRLATNQAILGAVVGLFDASERVTAAEFARFHRALTTDNANLAGIQGVGFAELLPRGGLQAFEQRIRREGQPGFRVRPPGQRPWMSAIVFLQPADWRNQRAMGFDMGSEAVRRQAMEQAAITGETALSGPVRLVQETNDQPQAGTLLYAPIYAGDGDFRSIADRWRRLRGWAFSPLRMGDLVTSVMNTVQNPDRNAAAVLLFDSERPLPQNLLYDSHGLVTGLAPSDGLGPAAGPAATPGLRLASTTWVPLRLANRTWLLGVQFSPRVNGGLPAGTWDLLNTALLGLSLSGLAALITDRLVANHLSLRRALQREAQAASERALAAAVFDSSPVGIVVTDPDGLIVRVNQAFTRISGFSELEARGHKANLLRSGRHDSEFYRQMWQAIVQRGHWSGEIWNRHRNGQIRRHELSITAVLDPQEQIVNFVGLLRDVTERYSQDRRMRHMATHDQLTGLANRTLLMEELQRDLALAHRKGQGVGLLFLDLNGFKAVNDAHGHSMGDALLRAVAQRLGRQVRGSDLLCRQGGDEFVVLISEAPDCERLQALAVKLLESLAEPFPDLPGDLRISASVGVARWPDHAADADGLLDAADNAMYQAKQRAGRSAAIALAAPLVRLGASTPAPVEPWHRPHAEVAETEEKGSRPAGSQAEPGPQNHLTSLGGAIEELPPPAVPDALRGEVSDTPPAAGPSAEAPGSAE